MIESGFELAPEKVFGFIKSIYESTDTFAADFDQEYPSPAAMDSRMEEMRKRPGGLFLVARDGDELTGYLFIAPRAAAKLRHTSDLNMGIREDARGKGIGTKLLNEALCQIRKEGIIEIVYLMVRADNFPAVHLYTKHGFEKLTTLTRDTKIDKRYYDGILMRLYIDGTAKPTDREDQSFR